MFIQGWRIRSRGIGCGFQFTSLRSFEAIFVKWLLHDVVDEGIQDCIVRVTQRTQTTYAHAFWFLCLNVCFGVGSFNFRTQSCCFVL